MHELYAWLKIKPDVTDLAYVKRKLHQLLLRVVLQLVQMGGAIAIQKGPTDAQILLIKELIGFQYTTDDLGVAMSIIESVCKFVFNNLGCNSSPSFNTSTLITPANTSDSTAISRLAHRESLVHSHTRIPAAYAVQRIRQPVRLGVWIGGSSQSHFAQSDAARFAVETLLATNPVNCTTFDEVRNDWSNR